MRYAKFVFIILLAVMGVFIYSHSARADVAAGNGGAAGCGASTQACGNGGGPSVVGNGGYKCSGGNGKSTALGGCAASASVSPAPMAPVYNYAASTSVGGGYTSMDKTAAQDLFVGLETDGNGDATETTMKANCPVNGHCRTYVYWSPTQLSCNTTGVTSYYTGLYNAPGPNDEAFTHDTSANPVSTTTRTYDTTTAGSSCDTSGGSTGNRSYYPNLGTAEVQNWITTNLFSAGGKTGFPDGDTWNCVRWDNMGPKPIDPSREWGNQAMGNGSSAVGYGIPLWRQAMGKFEAATSSYGCTAMNSEGPGSANYSGNNDGTSSIQSGVGVVNWAVDDEDVCDNLGGATSTLEQMFFEKVIASQSTVNNRNSVFVYPFNMKVAVNTAARHWADTNCDTIPLGITGMTGEGGSSSIPGTTSWLARAYGVVMRGLMEPTGYTGALNAVGVWMSIRFSADIQGASRESIYPEDGLQMTLPEQALAKWCWGGTASCDGNGQSTSDALGNGCYNASGDVGGINAFAQCSGQGTMPTLANDASGGTGEVLYRSFGKCYKYGVLLGSGTEHGCAVVLNNSGTDVAISSLNLNGHTFTQALTPTGTELYDDPITSGNPVCVSATVCTGAWATTAISTSTVIPHCTAFANGSSKQAVWDGLEHVTMDTSGTNLGTGQTFSITVNGHTTTYTSTSSDTTMATLVAHIASALNGDSTMAGYIDASSNTHIDTSVTPNVTYGYVNIAPNEPFVGSTPYSLSVSTTGTANATASNSNVENNRCVLILLP